MIDYYKQQERSLNRERDFLELVISKLKILDPYGIQHTIEHSIWDTAIRFNIKFEGHKPFVEVAFDREQGTPSSAYTGWVRMLVPYNSMDGSCKSVGKISFDFRERKILTWEKFEQAVLHYIVGDSRYGMMLFEIPTKGKHYRPVTKKLFYSFDEMWKGTALKPMTAVKEPIAGTEQFDHVFRSGYQRSIYGVLIIQVSGKSAEEMTTELLEEESFEEDYDGFYGKTKIDEPCIGKTITDFTFDYDEVMIHFEGGEFLVFFEPGDSDESLYFDDLPTDKAAKNFVGEKIEQIYIDKRRQVEDQRVFIIIRTTNNLRLQLGCEAPHSKQGNPECLSWTTMEAVK